MSYQLSDRLFVALAKKVGFPSYDALRRCRDLQLEWIEAGTPASLFSVAVIEGTITTEQVAAFLRWGQQITHTHNGKSTSDQRPPLHDTQVVQVEVQVDDEPEEMTEDDLILEAPPSEELDLLADSLPDAAPLPARPAVVEDEPLFMEDDEDDRPVFADDYDDGIEVVEDTGELKLLPDDDDEDMFALRRMDTPPRMKRPGKPDTGVMEVLDEAGLDFVDEDEVSEVFEVKATRAVDDPARTKASSSAVDLGLEDDPLMGVFDALDSQDKKKKRKRSEPESRHGGLISVFDDDSEPLPALEDKRMYTPEEVLEVIDSEDWRAHSGDWRDDDDDIPELTTDEIRRPVRRRRSRKKSKVSSGASFRTTRRSGSRSRSSRRS